MADSFFGFNTSLTTEELDGAPELDEEEYDALNHETFGENAFQGDWEEDHTRFAEVTENSRLHRNSFNSEKDDDLDLETRISQLVLEGEEEEKDEEKEDGAPSQIFSKTSKSINIPNNCKLQCGGGYNSSSVWSIDSLKTNESSTKLLHSQTSSKSSSLHFLPPQISKIPTVQELERDLIQKNKQNNKSVERDAKGNVNQIMNQGRNFFQNQQPNISTSNLNIPPQNTRNKFTFTSGTSNSIPPGFGAHQRFSFLQHQQEMVLLRSNVNMPMMLNPRLMMPPYMMPNPPHPLLLAQNPLLAPPQKMRFMPPHPMILQQQLQQLQQYKIQQRSNYPQSDGQKNNGRINSNNNVGHSNQSWVQTPERRGGGGGDFDEYAGLMNNRERQWLLNIQIIQLTSDKPHLDDYYYTQWKMKQEKGEKSKEQTKNGMKTEHKEPFFASNRKSHNTSIHRDRRDSERDSVSAPSPRVYVPLQFENSLGKLQCVSVIAPRKIIDLDVVSEPQTDATPLASHRDSRKTKKLLLELERLYLLAMEIEDIDNNMKLEEPHLSKAEIIDKILSSFLSEDRFLNFMCIRKGKTLLLRTLTHLGTNDWSDQVFNIWCRIIKSLPIIVRRDQNDGLLLQMYSFFKKWINTASYNNLYSLSSLLLPEPSPNHIKNTPRAVSPNSGKSILSTSLFNKFGVSVVSLILTQGEAVYPKLEDKEQLDWASFIFSLMKQMTSITNMENIPKPLDPLPSETVTSILNRSTGLHIQDYASAKKVLNCFQ